jgi:uncharacterized protein (DUF1810 family)
MADPFDLQRFVDAQAGAWETALRELGEGRKRSHWMWFVFPQARGLGHSPMAHHYGIVSLPEAQAYLDHPVLGPRLVRCAEAALGCGEDDLHRLFGSPDDMKFISSMSLFRLADPQGAGPWQTALDRWNGGRPDPRTVELMSA